MCVYFTRPWNGRISKRQLKNKKEQRVYCLYVSQQFSLKCFCDYSLKVAYGFIGALQTFLFSNTARWKLFVVQKLDNCIFIKMFGNRTKYIYIYGYWYDAPYEFRFEKYLHTAKCAAACTFHYTLTIRANRY